MLQPKLVNQLVSPLAPFMPRDWLHFQYGKDVFLNRELPENRRFLWQIADAILARP